MVKRLKVTTKVPGYFYLFYCFMKRNAVRFWYFFLITESISLNAFFGRKKKPYSFDKSEVKMEL